MSQRTFMKLPVNPDEGFPQSFRLNFNDRTYQILLYVNAPEEEAGMPEDYTYDLLDGSSFMIMRVAREGAVGPQVIFQRKLVRNLEHEAAELVFVFPEIRVDRRNLNGVGAFGSSVSGGIGARWAS